MPHQIAGAYFITKYFHRREKLVFSDATQHGDNPFQDIKKNNL